MRISADRRRNVPRAETGVPDEKDCILTVSHDACTVRYKDSDPAVNRNEKKISAMDFDGHSVYIRSLEIRKAAGRRIRAGMAAVRAMLFQKGFLHDQRSCVAEKKEIDQG